MDDQLKIMLQKLGLIINEVLVESPKIKGVIEDIRQSGYEVVLLIEASANLSKCGADAEQDSDRPGSRSSKVHLKITPDDIKFLKSLKISSDQ